MSETTRDRLAQWVEILTSRTRFGKFVSVGAIGAACDTAVLVALVEWAGLLEEVAVLVGIEVSILVMFGLNESWTFRRVGESGWRARVCRLGRSHAVRAGGVLA